MHIHWYPLTSIKNIWPKISVAFFANWFQSIFTVGGWRMYPFNLPLLALACIPAQSCKKALFWSLHPARTRNHKPEHGSSPTFIFEARFRPESQIYRGSKDIGVGAGKFLGVRRIFARILTNFPENWAPVFSNQKMLGAIFANTFT